MAMINKVQSQVAGKVSFTMDKALLKVLSKVTSDPFFSVESNWKLVNFVFKHNESSRRLVASFRGSFSQTKNVKIKSGMLSTDSMQLHKIIISDMNRNSVVIKRSEINGVSSFDFTLGSDAGQPQINYVNWDLKYDSSIVFDQNGGISVPTEKSYWWINKSSSGLLGDFKLEYRVNGSSFFETAMGVSDNLNLPSPNGSQNFQGGYALFSWHNGFFDYVENDSVSEIHVEAQAGENIVLFERVGSSVTIKINGTLVKTFIKSGTLYPLGRSWKAANPLVSSIIVSQG
jgi:hypothetical protein